MSSELSPPALLWSFVESSLDEAEFLWTRWESALDAPDYTLSELTFWCEERLLGALDGVLVAGEAAIEPWLSPALAARDPGRLSAASYLLGSLSAATPTSGPALAALVGALASADAGSGPALGSGLARVAGQAALDSLWSRGDALSSHGRAALLAAFAFARRAPTASYSTLLDEPELTLAATAAALLAYLPAAERGPRLGQALASSRIEVREAAIDAGLQTGNQSCWQRCRELLHEPASARGALLRWGAQLGAQAELRCILEAAQRPEQQRDALWALGFAGTRTAAEACLEHLRRGPDAAHARVAAEAFVAITGLEPSSLVGCQLSEPERSADDLATDSDSDAAFAPARDAGLVALDADVVTRWWRGAEARFDPERRYLAGRPWSFAAAVDALLHGPTRRRHAIASELCARSGGRFDLQTRAFSSLQHAALTKLVGLPAQVRNSGLSALGLPAPPGD